RAESFLSGFSASVALFARPADGFDGTWDDQQPPSRLKQPALRYRGGLSLSARARSRAAPEPVRAISNKRGQYVLVRRKSRPASCGLPRVRDSVVGMPASRAPPPLTSQFAHRDGRVQSGLRNDLHLGEPRVGCSQPRRLGLHLQAEPAPCSGTNPSSSG